MKCDRMVWGCLALLALGACGDSKCKTFADKFERSCVETETQTIFVDGVPAGQLHSQAEAEKRCHDGREESMAWCRDASDEVFACASTNYAGTHAAWQKDNHCQDGLTAARTKPR